MTRARLIFKSCKAPVAQMAVHSAVNRRVVGSSPTGSDFFFVFSLFFTHNQMMCGCGSVTCTQCAKGKGVEIVVEWAEGSGFEFESEEG